MRIVSDPVYPSVAALRQYPGPFTSIRYARVKGLSLFEWVPNDTTDDDGINYVAPASGGGVGRWRVVPEPDVSVSQPAVALADSSETITLGTGRRRSVAVSLLTAERTKTVSTTGAELGDVMVIERTDTSHHRLRVVNGGAGGGSYWLNRPGSLTLRFDGTNWREDSPVLRAALSVFTPWEFGAVGDGTVDDTTAIQAMFDAFVAGGLRGRIELGKGTFSITPIQVVGNVSTPFRLIGDSGSSAAFNGTKFVARGSANTSALIRFTGIVFATIENVEFDANELCKYGCLIDTATGEAGSSNIVLRRCTFARPRDISGAAAFAAGPESDPQTQSDTITLEHCYLYGKPSTPAYNADGFKTNVGGNTKCFTLVGCNFSNFRRHINWDNVSGAMLVQRCQLEGSYVADITQGAGGHLTVIACQAERSARLYTGVSGAKASFLGCEWNGGPACTDDVCISTGGAQVEIRGNYLASQRGTRTITNINTTTDVITYTGGEFGQIPDGSTITVWSTTGQIGNLTQAPGVQDGKASITYYVRDGAGSAPNFTCKLEATLGGGAIDLTGTFGGSLLFVSPVKVLAAGTQYGDSVAGAVISEQNWYYGATDHAPIYESANDLLGAVYAVGSAANGVPTKIRSTGDNGGISGISRRLRDLSGTVEETSRLQTYELAISDGSQIVGSRVYSGAPGRAWHVQRFKYTDFANRAATTGFQYFRLPARARITAVYLEVVTPGAGSGISALTADVGDAYAGPGTILAASDLTAAAGTVYGVTDAQLGTGMVRAAAIQGGYRPAAVTWASTVLCRYNFNATGANLSALTAGEWLISIEYTVPPRV